MLSENRNANDGRIRCCVPFARLEDFGDRQFFPPYRTAFALIQEVEPVQRAERSLPMFVNLIRGDVASEHTSSRICVASGTKRTHVSSGT